LATWRKPISWLAFSASISAIHAATVAVLARRRERCGTGLGDCLFGLDFCDPGDGDDGVGVGVEIGAVLAQLAVTVCRFTARRACG
jgi:hypothetical protein